MLRKIQITADFVLLIETLRLLLNELATHAPNTAGVHGTLCVVW